MAVSGASAPWAALRADQNRIVCCAADKESASKISLLCSSSVCEIGAQLGRLRTIMLVVDQFSRAALQATIRPSGRGLPINGSIASIFAADNNDSAAMTLEY